MKLNYLSAAIILSLLILVSGCGSQTYKPRFPDSPQFGLNGPPEEIVFQGKTFRLAISYLTDNLIGDFNNNLIDYNVTLEEKTNIIETLKSCNKSQVSFQEWEIGKLIYTGEDFNGFPIVINEIDSNKAIHRVYLYRVYSQFYARSGYSNVYEFFPYVDSDRYSVNVNSLALQKYKDSYLTSKYYADYKTLECDKFSPEQGISCACGRFKEVSCVATFAVKRTDPKLCLQIGEIEIINDCQVLLSCLKIFT